MMMKNLKLVLPALAIILGLGIVFTQSAFTKKDPINLAYQYTGADDNGVMTPANWTPITYNPSPTECESIGDLPCVVQFNDSQYDDITDFLSNHSNATQVNESALTKRHKEPLNR